MARPTLNILLLVSSRCAEYRIGIVKLWRLGYCFGAPYAMDLGASDFLKASKIHIPMDA